MGCRRRQDSALAVAWTAWAPRGVGVERVPRAFLADGDGDVRSLLLRIQFSRVCPGATRALTVSPELLL